MEDIKVGEYVRTKEWGIAKVHKVDNGKVTWVKNKNNRVTHYFTQLKEPSKDLIDLIEEGDYVNGLKINCILEVGKEKILRCVFPYREDSTEYKDLEEKGSEYCQLLHLRKDDIKSIVTKEQFESIKYEV